MSDRRLEEIPNTYHAESAFLISNEVLEVANSFVVNRSYQCRTPFTISKYQRKF